MSSSNTQGYGQQSSAMSTEAGWEKIGERTIDLGKDRDEFTLNRAEKYDAIKLRVKDKPVNMKSMEVEFNNGKKQDQKFTTPIKAQGESEVINLTNKDQDLKKITFAYDNKSQADQQGKSGKAVVEIWGKKSTDKGGSQGVGTNNEKRSNTSTGTNRSSTGTNRSAGSSSNPTPGSSTTR
jgi:hypothetical protein